MARLSTKQKNDQIIVKRKLVWGEKISEREVQVFKSTLIRGLVRPNVEGKKITYTVPGNQTLQKYLQSGIGKKEFFVIIAQIIELTKKIDRYGLNINNLILNIQYVYMNNLTKEMHFIYQPVVNKDISTSIYAFVNDIAYAAVFQLNEDTQFINDFMKFLQNMERYSATEIEQYILKKYPETYKQVKREQPKSTVLHSKAWSQEQDDDDMDTALLEDDDDMDTILLMEDEDMDTGLLEEDEDMDTMLLMEDEDMDTCLLDEEEPQTVLLNEEVRKYPYLIRMTTYEQVEVIIAVVIIVMAFGVVMLLKQKESNTTSTTEIGNVDNNDVVNEEPDSEYDASWIEKEKENDNFTESQTVHEDGADEHYPFYGVWIAATKDQFEAETMYNEFIAQGFDVQMVVTSEWSNLNRESYYAVSVGMHSSKESAKAQLKEVKRRGYESAYIKYSGNYLLD